MIHYYLIKPVSIKKLKNLIDKLNKEFIFIRVYELNDLSIFEDLKHK
jgi:hypothetical protein